MTWQEPRRPCHTGGMVRHVLVLACLLVAGTAAAAPAVVITDQAILVRDPITFETGKAVITSASAAPLDAVAAALKADSHPALVEIGVHTDERGAAEYNLKISQQRAEAIRDYLVAKGVSAGRLRATGYGESRPLDKHHDEKAWAKNRRIELVILQRMT